MPMKRHHLHFPAIATKRDVDEIATAIQANTAAVRELNGKGPQATTANPESAKSLPAENSNEKLETQDHEQDRGRGGHVLPASAPPFQQPDQTLGSLEVKVSQEPIAKPGNRSVTIPSAESSITKGASTSLEEDARPDHLLTNSLSSKETAKLPGPPREPIARLHADFAPVVPQLPEINRPLETFIATAIRNHHTTIRMLEQLVSLTSRQQSQIESLARELENVNMRAKYARTLC